MSPPLPQRLQNGVRPDLLLTCGAVAISFSGVWVTFADVAPSTSAFYRVFFGALFLLVTTLLAKERLLPSPAEILLGTACGIVFALDLICWHISILFVGPGLATILGNFQVFILAAIGFFLLQERYGNLFFVAIPLAIIGLFLIVGVRQQTMTPSYQTGLLFGFATAFCYAAYILLLRQLSRRSTLTFQPMLLVSLATSAALLVWILLRGEPLAIPTVSSFVSLAALGLFSQCLGWVCIAVSLPKINASHAGLLLLLQPSLAFVWDVVFFSRPTTAINWVGVALTLTAIHLGMRARERKN